MIKTSRIFRTKQGFTITEVSLSMVFVSFLLLAIAALIMYSTTLYQKGLTLRAVNNTGLELVDELTRTISYSRTTNSDKYYFQYYGTVYLPNAGNQQLNEVPYWGVFCTGTYSYAWNTGYISNNSTYRRTASGANFTDEQRLKVNGSSNFRLIRMNDSTRELCASVLAHGADSPNRTPSTPSVTNIHEMFSASSEHQLALYDFRVYPPTNHQLTGHTFYTGSFVLGTIHGSVDITTTSNVCKEPSDGLTTDFTYCAINKFNFAVRATGANQ